MNMEPFDPFEGEGGSGGAADVASHISRSAFSHSGDGRWHVELPVQNGSAATVIGSGLTVDEAAEKALDTLRLVESGYEHVPRPIR